MKKSIQQAISCVVALFVMGIAPLTVSAASYSAEGQITGSRVAEQIQDSFVTYRGSKPANRTQKMPLQGRIIVVDPGHGGSDTGAIGPNRVTEKQVTLSIAQELRKLLTAGGATVVMTRTSDRDVAYAGASDREELRARIDIANRKHADLFVSIHADAFMGAAGGTTTYYYDETDTTLRLAQSVQDNMVAQLKLYDRGTQQNDFYVLEHARVPAILTEAAFISNPKEEKLLANPSFNRKVAMGIYNGIHQYFQVL